jgi:hypothetical protein
VILNRFCDEMPGVDEIQSRKGGAGKRLSRKLLRDLIDAMLTMSVLKVQSGLRGCVRRGPEKTHVRHWPCIATKDLMPVLTPIKLLV